jgi:YidC/Oxa1 family membrane protein insertase
MDRNSILALAIIFLILLLWQGPYSKWLNPDQGEIAYQDIPETELSQTKQTRRETGEITGAETIQATEDTIPVSTFGTIKFTNLPAEKIIIDSPKYYGVISTKGGTIEEWILKEYPAFTGERLNIIRNNDHGNLGLSFESNEAFLIDLNQFDFIPKNRSSYNGEYKLSVDSGTESIKLTADLGQGRYIHKIFSFDPNTFNVMFDVEFENCQDIMGRYYEYEVTWGSGIRSMEKDIQDDMRRSKSLALFGEDKEEFDVGSSTVLTKMNERPLEGEVHWIATRNKYFCSAIIPLDTKGKGFQISGINIPNEIDIGSKNYISSMKMNFERKPVFSNSFLVYLGPVDHYTFKELTNSIGKDVQISKILDYHYITRPLTLLIYKVFNFLHNFIPNYGVVIIMFSLIITLLMYPLTAKSYKSMKKMQVIQPMMAELKEKYKDDPKKFQQAQMNMFKELKINPLGGCLPMVFQMPVFFAIYPIFRTIELRGANFFWWINDLSAPDTVATIPLPIIGDYNINILLIIYAISLFVQQKIMMKGPQQNKMMVYMMPVMLLFFMSKLSSGFILYFIFFNLLSITQRYIVRDDDDDKTNTDVAVKKLENQVSNKKVPKKVKKK